MKLNKVFRKGDGEGCALVFIAFIFIILIGWIYLHNNIISEKKDTIEGKVQSMQITIERNGAETTLIVFTDGRTKKFLGVSKKPIENDKYYTITYDGFARIVQIEEVKP
jgi:hypothetical protein